MANKPLTLFDQIWNEHVVTDLEDGFYLLFIDRHNVNDYGARCFTTLDERGLKVEYPELTFATADHTVATLQDTLKIPSDSENPYVANLRHYAKKFGVRLFDVGDPGHGIIHVNAAELGLAMPGLTIVCGDSHTCTLGALGSVAWGIGQSDSVHVLATQTSVQRKPKNMRITLQGSLPPGITAKDVMLYVIGEIGVSGAAGHAVEFAGPVIRNMSMEARFTICNMAIETGARFGLIAPDETTFNYLKGRELAPVGEEWTAAIDYWRGLASDKEAAFDRELTIDVSHIEPQITWGTNPGQVVGINAKIPKPTNTSEENTLAYINLEGGELLKGTPIDMVFIGSCTNSRLSDLRAAAEIARGRKVAEGITAWVVPGSQTIKQAAESEGLDKVFLDAGFSWGQPGCSMCGGTGDSHNEIAAPGKRIISTTNRNFFGRQGPGSRTHLASPAMAAAAAIAGRIVDARDLESSND